MLGADGNKPTGKPGQRKRKAEGKKAEARKRKTVQETTRPQDLQSDQLDAAEAISPPATSVDDVAISGAPLETFPHEAETASEVVTAIEAPPAETFAADSAPAATEAASATVVATEMSPAGLAAIDWSPAAAPDNVPVPSAEPAMVAPAEILQPTSAEAAPVSYQTIANAYGDLTRRSLDQTTSFFERFLGVRSFDKAFELQTEFAKQAYDNFVAESQKIRDLHRELTRQRLQSWEGFVGMTKAR
jgi:hypothetical protein